MSTRDLERIARSFVGQKLTPEYIVHYLMETYQLDQKSAQDILNKVSPTRGGRHGAQMGSESARVPVVRRKFM